MAGAGALGQAGAAAPGPGTAGASAAPPSLPEPGKRLRSSPLPPGAPGCGRTNEGLAGGSKTPSSAWRNEQQPDRTLR